MAGLLQTRPSLRWVTGLVLALFASVFVSTAASANGASPAYIYVSSSSAGVVDGVSFGSEDILRYDTVSDTWEMFFDASDVGLGAGNIDGFAIIDSGTQTEIALSLAGPLTIAGLGTVDDSDAILFVGTSGPATGGSLSLLLDGSDIGLTSGGEDIDALALNGSDYLVSTLGSAGVPRTGGTLAAGDEDLLNLDVSSTGNLTAGVFSMFYDGSDVGLAPEDVDGAWLDEATGTVYLSLTNAYNVGGVSGDGGDVLAFTGTTGDATSGTFSLFFDNDAHRFGGENIDGLDIEFQSGSPSGQADLSITKIDDADPVTPGDTVTYTIDVTNGGPDPAVNVVVTDVLPAGTTFASTTGCAQDPNGLPCSLGTIDAGESASYTMAVTVDAGVQGLLTNTASVTSSTADPDPSNNSTTETTYVGVPPTAVDDGAPTNSNPGDPFHTAVDTTLAATNGSLQDLDGNDNLGDPAGAVGSFGGGDLGGSVLDNLPGDTATFGTAGSLTVNADGSFSFTPDSGFEGSFSFQYRLANSLGSSVATVTVVVGDRPAAMGDDLVYLSTTSGGTVDAVTYSSEDILVYDLGTDAWALFLDGSDIGIGAGNINGFAIIDNPVADEVLFTLTAPLTIPGLGRIDDSDILRFVGTAGENTVATTLELYVDGSDLRLTAGGEDIDAITESGSDLAISTVGSFSARRPNGLTLSGSDEDLSLMILTATGPTTTGGLEALFDGSDVDLTAEDLTGAWDNPANNSIFATSLNGFNVPGLSGDSNDVFVFTGTTGPNTSGTFSTFFDADAARLTGKSIDGLHISLRSSPTITSDGGGDTAAVSVAENTTAVTDVEATDDTDSEGSGLTYSLTTNTGGADNSLFTLDGSTGVLTFSAPPDFEAPGDTNGDNDYEVEVTVTDSAGLTDTQNITVTVTDVLENTAPVITSLGGGDTAVDSIPETGTSIENMSATDDLDTVGSGLTWSVTGGDDQTKFGITANTGILVFNNLPDFENPTDTNGDNVYEVQVTVTDSGGLTDTQDIAVTVTDVNEAPVITSLGGGSTATDSVPEYVSQVEVLQATDPEGDTVGSGLTWTITGGADTSRLALAGNVLVFVYPEDFENPTDANGDNVYEVQVTVTDSSGLTDTQDIAITVTDILESVTIEVRANGDDADTPPGPIINVGDPVNLEYVVTNTGDAELSIVVTDSTFGTLSCGSSTLSSGESTNCFTSTTATAGQFSTTGTVTATPTGATTNITATDMTHYLGNTAPTITSNGAGDTATVNVAENTTAVTDVEATDDIDSEGSSLSYGLTTNTGGADNGLFNLDALSGVITFVAAPDYENPGDANTDNDYEIEVTVTDSSGLTDTQNITVTVTDVTEAFVLNAGDVVIIGDHTVDGAGNHDEVSWVPLVNLPAGTVLYFSDAGYNSTAGAWLGTGRIEEWLIRFTVPAAGITAGTVQTFKDDTSPAGYDQPSTVTQFGALGPSGSLLNLSMVGFGEEVVLFTSTDDPTTATFGQSDFTPLFHIDSGSNDRPLFTFDSAALTHTTDVAPGLTVGTNAVGLRNPTNGPGGDEWDQIRYVGSRVGTKAALLAAIANAANWEGTDGDQGSGWSNAGGNFTVS